MKPNTQSYVIAQSIEACLDKGMIEKSEIYDKVGNELGVPRPTIRRVARDLLKKYQGFVDILNHEQK